MNLLNWAAITAPPIPPCKHINSYKNFLNLPDMQTGAQPTPNNGGSWCSRPEMSRVAPRTSRPVSSQCRWSPGGGGVICLCPKNSWLKRVLGEKSTEGNSKNKRVKTDGREEKRKKQWPPFSLLVSGKPVWYCRSVRCSSQGSGSQAEANWSDQRDNTQLSNHRCAPPDPKNCSVSRQE